MVYGPAVAAFVQMRLAWMQAIDDSVDLFLHARTVRGGWER